MIGAAVLSCISSAQTSLADEAWPTCVGVSLAGPEFGMHERNLSNASPGVHGVDFVYNSPDTCRRVAQAEDAAVLG